MQSVWIVVVALLSLQIETLSNQLLVARGAVEDEEAAAFLVGRSDGALDLVHWPRSRTYRSAHWNGPLPQDTLAIIHTHPSKVPYPSLQDRAEARRLGLPIYVVSPRLLCTAETDGTTTCKSNNGGPGARRLFSAS